MAAKRLFDEMEPDADQRRIGRSIRTRPFFASIIGETFRGNSWQNICTALEPMLRRVVNEEVERGLVRGARSLTWSPSLRIHGPEPSNLQLIFSKNLSLPIFTGAKIRDAENNPLLLCIVDKSGDEAVQTTLPYPIQLDIVVLDGDFPHGELTNSTWSMEEFNNSIVKERTGKRPLLVGDVLVTMRDGFAVVGDIEFTDNSHWIRGRKFRLGARVVPGSCHGVRILEAFTEPFAVRDHRGELYRKHHPPMLNDDVWRLENISKDGAFHKRLAFKHINTVQEFLKLFIVDPAKLRRILGAGMSDKKWEAVIKHASTCLMGNKVHIFHGPHYTVTLNPICQLVRAVINGQIYANNQELSSINQAYVKSLVREAYINWNSLEEVDELLSETALLTQGDPREQCPNHHQTMERPFQQLGYLPDKATDIIYSDVGSSNWPTNPTYHGTLIDSGIGYYIMDSTVDGDLEPSKHFPC
ncbi:hypothetical protein VitviT2T_025848 [Vitis vinifera]|uniref:Protein SAR deficient 1 n=2 Tax=Vitis vinifera TaxID=29760 RepID=A0ABY9DN31_VITVI|eukprot:XP_002276874.1 PREDICTED: protein SAR DEFICIENT 1 [Vitis vinifera]